MIKLKQAARLLAAFVCLGAAFIIVTRAGLPQPSKNRSRAEQFYAAELRSQAPAFALRNATLGQVALYPAAGVVTILNFWSTTCAPCRREMRDLQRLHDRHSDWLRILAVNLGESPEAVAAWRDELNLTFDLLLDPSLTVARRYQVRGLPTTYLLDEDQLIQNVYFGQVTYDHLLGEVERLAPRVESL